MNLDPSTIGRFKVLGELGRGAMGVVYMAEDPVLKRGLAIKVVHGGKAAQEEALARFQREAEISARLNHPNVITVFDVGKEPELGPFMAMELVDGEVLADVLAKETLDPERAVLLLIQGLQALEAAHAQGIIHRDFKPENLMVTKDGRLKLMDFGIARHDNPALTTTGILCTPSFAAPELLNRQPASPATDRWAYAVTAFQMLTGVLPFQAESLTGLLYAIAHEAPGFPEELPPGLAKVFARAFEKDPAGRYPDLRSFLEDLLTAMSFGPETLVRCQTILEATPAVGSASGGFRRSGGDLRVWLRLPRLAWVCGGLALLLLAWAWSTGRLIPRRLSLESYPPGAAVFLDDSPLGKTPLSDVRIPAKAHVLRLEKEGFQVLERTLRSEDRTLALTLMAKPLSLDLNSEPAGAEVLLNGVRMGTTPLQNLQMPGEGPQRVQLRLAGFEPWSMAVTREHRPPELIRLKKTEARKSFWKKLFSK